jgi:hypothetical protein
MHKNTTTPFFHALFPLSLDSKLVLNIEMCPGHNPLDPLVGFAGFD